MSCARKIWRGIFRKNNWICVGSNNLSNCAYWSISAVLDCISKVLVLIQPPCTSTILTHGISSLSCCVGTQRRSMSCCCTVSLIWIHYAHQTNTWTLGWNSQGKGEMSIVRSVADIVLKCPEKESVTYHIIDGSQDGKLDALRSILFRMNCKEGLLEPSLDFF